jgi:hypothetical protein
MLKTYGSIKQFTGQGVQKSNDDIKMIYHRKTNKHCATVEALRVRQRRNMLKQYARVKRKYGKINNAFWRGGGISKSLLPDRNCIHIRKEKVQLWNEV